MGREVRMIKPGWLHPQDGTYSDGTTCYVPLFAGPFSKELADWQQGQEMWNQGLVEDWTPDRHNTVKKLWKPRDSRYNSMTWSDWQGDCPVQEDYMPEWSADEATSWVMYETTTEGSPISPAFDTAEELCRWLYETGASVFGDSSADYDYWMSLCNETEPTCENVTSLPAPAIPDPCISVLDYDGETLEISVNGVYVMTLNHDEHGSEAMRSVETVLKKVAHILGVKFTNE